MSDFLASSHLLSVEDLSTEEMNGIFRTADSFLDLSSRTVKKVPSLRGKTLVNLFYEPSTRTRTSFEIAAKRLSADVINITTSQSSVVKGESLLDTVRTIEALGADGVVIRHPSSGVPEWISRRVGCHVINAGDGLREHPTQALLDLYTILKRKGHFEGLQVAIVGDILHSRVARSNIRALTRMGVRVRLVGPPTLIPADTRGWKVEVVHDLKDGVRGCDVVMALRLQLERATASYIPSLGEYARLYGISPAVLRLAKPDVLVLHPGPINRGIEIQDEESFLARSGILDQVHFGVGIRMAVLYLLMAGQ
ncbi:MULTISPECIES: aspartate carbamoyltransferase catalytic subunit [Leptospirillum]|uniref:Aspartate carbamoyltransferase n=2 Tax=Leptospirillum ferriphilum TaxID=178606 RepID=A0A059XVK4_9BACT|nr:MULTISPECIES: aspartate carbamoyltransferase catalytic subunit [Leptospirillum]AIA30913.1 aspartate carbamoyltransferase [Leptospirillum ferriphilum YSK]EAY56781.1 MAG: Aspartate carbamoyltransferase [Leptospirillum rubarum]EIJ76704.1 MAG: Aspartate carbamoyltransferase [Leptospirillum sp. Group II 'C75']MCL5259874.1 aspartate carbamoyltransferase catalytic subunit [Nitrospirota bacterium]